MKRRQFYPCDILIKHSPGVKAPGGTSVGILRQVCIQQGKDVQVSAEQGICQTD